MAVVRRWRVALGGAATGATVPGWAATGAAAAGGMTTGRTATGPTATGAAATGRTATGGVVVGGTATGGAAAGRGRRRGRADGGSRRHRGFRTGGRCAEETPVGSERGTTIPLIMMCFLLAGTFVCGSIAASAAFLAQRDLAGLCDGAAVAAANGFSRSAGGGGAGGPESRSDGMDSLPLDDEAVQRAIATYRLHQLPADEGALSITASTDGRVATVTCRRRVRIPFGALLGHRDGLDRTVVARARSPLD